jgi:hypothetical protein
LASGLEATPLLCLEAAPLLYVTGTEALSTGCEEIERTAAYTDRGAVGEGRHIADEESGTDPSGIRLQESLFFAFKKLPTGFGGGGNCVSRCGFA